MNHPLAPRHDDPWGRPDRSVVQVMFMDTGIGRWSYKHRGRWYICWSQAEALYGWAHHPEMRPG